MTLCKASDLFNREQAPDLMSDIEIAKQLGMTRDRVFQTRVKAMAKIRSAILADADLREAAERLTGEVIEKPEPCATPDCETPYYDTKAVADRNQPLNTFLLCRECRGVMRGKVTLAQ